MRDQRKLQHRTCYLLVLFFLQFVVGMDLCHDPRMTEKASLVSTNGSLQSSCGAPSYVVRTPFIDDNPYHALHDSLWALSHYLRTCVKQPLTVYIPTTQNLRLCVHPNAKDQPKWGYCVAFILARAAGALVDQTSTRTEKVGRLACPKIETVMLNRVEGWPKTFRGLAWYGKYGDGLRHAQVDNAVAAGALRHLRSAVIRFYGLSGTSGVTGNKVNVLVYDRSDARRRRWRNAKDIVEIVRNIRGTKVSYVRRMPLGLGRQVDMFRSADLLLSPHGAAMANSVFMKAGSVVVEVWKVCKEDWVKRRGKEWTGWHAELIGLKLRYISCRKVDNVTHEVDSKEVERVVLEMVERIRESRREQGSILRKRLGVEAGVSFMPFLALIILAYLLKARTYMDRKGSAQARD